MPSNADMTTALAAIRDARMSSRPPSGGHMNVVAFVILLLGFLLGVGSLLALHSPVMLALFVILGVVFAQAPKVASEWERAVVLRLGRFTGLRGPGLFWVVPFVENVNTWIDQRVITTGFAAEQSLTADTVPVNVDAVLFWLVHDPQKAALEVQDYFSAVTWAAQTALRDIIGRTSLGDLLLGREKIEGELQALIDERSSPWGVTVQAVEMRDVLIPESLQDAMSRQAQATREKQARVILGEAEVEIATLFNQAATRPHCICAR
jgi:regulator of protease activity HflC (stomatin/prohibitin superfamily)